MVTAQQTKLYSLQNPHPDVRVDAVEFAFREEIDGPASALLPRLAAGETLGRDDRLVFARHLAMQSLRTPWAHSQFNKHSEFFALETFRSFLEHVKKNPEWAKGLPVSVSPEMVDVSLDAINSNGVGIKMTHDAWLKNLLRFLLELELPALIAALPWVIVRSHAGSFVTSDNPVVKARVRAPSPGEQRAGWQSPSIETTYALGPDTLLVIRADLQEGSGTASKRWREDVNRRCVLYANEEFYASSEQPGLHSRFRNAEVLSVQTRVLKDGSGPGALHTAEPYVPGIPYS